MSTTTKTSNRKTATKKETVAAPVAAPVAAAPAKKEVPVPVAAPVAAPAPVAPTATAAVEEVNVVSEFNALVEKVNAMRGGLATIFSDMKKLEKRIPRELKKASKGRRNRKAAVEGDAAKEGVKENVFTRPNKISEELCVFLGKAKGSEMSRSDVTKAVCGYAKQKGLMDKQVIKADASLRKLLHMTENDELKIQNLQRFLKIHYIKAVPATA
jgi:hypothetical protein